jgi:predicted dehydrogenase
MEAFMYRLHPQWRRAVGLVRDGGIGEPLVVHTLFSYFNEDPSNVRNQADLGGGALMDIGCYAISLARLVFGAEPRRALGLVDTDPRFKTDRIVSAVLDFGRRSSLFTCSTQLQPCQRVDILGTRGRIEIEIPFNAPPDRRCILFFDARGVLGGSSVETIEIEACDQYTIQGDRFSEAIQDGLPEVYPLEESLANFRVIDALFRSAQDGGWVTVAE